MGCFTALYCTEFASLVAGRYMEIVQMCRCDSSFGGCKFFMFFFCIFMHGFLAALLVASAGFKRAIF